jgi:hypothetical protein
MMTSKSLKRAMFLTAAATLLLAGLGARLRTVVAQDAAPASLTKDSSLYPGDFGPAEIDVSEYPKAHREAYRLYAFKCAACHTIARPINAQFLELTDEEAKKAKTEDPELFKDDKIVKVEEKIWARYVKRMMAKPGCPVKGEDGKKIYEFLVYDAKIRKMGPNAKAWREHRAKLVADFKQKYPDAYQKLYAAEK